MSLLDPIPLTVVAGGAEMPSVVRRILGLRSGLALVEPEGATPHGPVPRILPGLSTAPDRHVVVHPDVGERSPGCPCCRLRLDLVDALATLVRRRSRPSHILVAVPDLADGPAESSVATVVHTVLSDPDVRREVRLDGVIATVDAVGAITRMRTGAALTDAVGAERLAMADRVLLARAQDLLGPSLEEVRVALGRLSRVASVLAPSVEGIVASQVLTIDAWHGAPAVMSPAGHEVAAGPAIDTEVGMAGAPETVVIRQRGVLDPGGVEEWLDHVIASHAPRLVRLQGALAVDGSASRVCCHGVGSYAMSHPEHEHADGRRSETSLVVLIGHGLPAEQLVADLRETVVR